MAKFRTEFVRKFELKNKDGKAIPITKMPIVISSTKFIVFQAPDNQTETKITVVELIKEKGLYNWEALFDAKIASNIT